MVGTAGLGVASLSSHVCWSRGHQSGPLSLVDRAGVPETPARSRCPRDGLGRACLGAGLGQSAGRRQGRSTGLGVLPRRGDLFSQQSQACRCRQVGISDGGLWANQGPNNPPFLAGTPENGSEPESRSPDNRTQLVPECMPGGRWCPAANVCVPLDASCHPQANGCTSGPGLPGALYALWREFLFSVPAGPPAQYSVCGPDLSLSPASPQATFLSAAQGLGLLTRHTQPAGYSHVPATSNL